MFAGKVRLNSALRDVGTLRSYLSLCNPSELDPGGFLAKVGRECHDLTPSESVLAFKCLDRVFRENSKCSFSSSELEEAKRSLLNNIRSKLYTLSDLNELCNITVSIVTSNMLSKSYVGDFLSRLDKLISRLNSADVAPVCDSLILLHLNGHKLDNICSKFYKVLLYDNILQKTDNPGLVKLVECLASLGPCNRLLERRLASETKSRVASNRITTDTVLSIIRANNLQKSRLSFLNPFLVSNLLETRSLDPEVLIKCLNGCKDLRWDFWRLDQLYLGNRDKLGLESKLDLLNSLARFRYKPSYLDELVNEASQHAPDLAFEGKVRLFKNFYELNVHENRVTESLIAALNNSEGLKYGDLFCDVLLGLCYFEVQDVRPYNSILFEIIRNEHRLTDKKRVALQKFYTIATSCLPKVGDSLDPGILAYLRKNSADSFERKRDPAVAFVSNTLPSHSYSVYEQVNVGGYCLDFVRPSSFTGAGFSPREQGVAIVIERCYRTSRDSSDKGDQRPQGAEEHSKSVLLKRVLEKLKINFATVSPARLRALTPRQQAEYLRRLLP